MHGTTGGRNRGRVYRCTRVHSGGHCPEPAYIPAEPVEAAVEDAFWRAQELEAEGREDTAAEERALERELARHEDAIARLLSPELLAVAGDMAAHAEQLRAARERRDGAAEALGRFQARQGRSAKKLPVAELRRAWAEMDAAERRGFLGDQFDCLALGRDRRLVLYPAGTGPADLPRPGFTRVPRLRPFSDDAPAGARVLAL
jgi:hypothetical protein